MIVYAKIIFFVLFFLFRDIITVESRIGMKLRKKRVVGLLLILIVLVVGISFGVKQLTGKEKVVRMQDLVHTTASEGKEYAKEENLKLKIVYEYSSEIPKDEIMEQSIKKDSVIHPNDDLVLTVSKGKVPIEEYQENNIDELGKVPIMMYHGIENMKDSETEYTGGNVDKDGYNRTTESFRDDLEFYYQSGYRMIRLSDYVDGKIDVPFGKSPIILTFDDGKENNFKVLGKKDGKLEIDPDCAVGILEEFKEKYPDFNVTATFFVNETLFQQPEYDEDILKWLVEHGYDIGNHTLTHPDFMQIDQQESNEEVAGIYALLDTIIPNKYVNIVALPFGSPYKMSHENYNVILNSKYEDKTYTTKAALRVGWEAEWSPFDVDFTPQFLKRVRAYDHDGTEFDIEMTFKLLEKNRYISDGDDKTVVIPKDKQQDLRETDLEVIAY